MRGHYFHLQGYSGYCILCGKPVQLVEGAFPDWISKDECSVAKQIREIVAKCQSITEPHLGNCEDFYKKISLLIPLMAKVKQDLEQASQED